MGEQADAGADTEAELFPLLVADVYELAGALRRSGEDLARPVGQSQARWQVLSVVSEGDWTVPAAARRLGVTRQAVQRIADRLVDDGLARFEPNPSHRRSPFLVLTPTGRRVLTEITDAAQGWNAEVASGLSPQYLEQTRATLREIVDRIQSISEPSTDLD